MWWWYGTNITPGCSGKKNSLASTLTPGKVWTKNYTPSSLHILLLLTHTVPPTSNCWSDHIWTPFLPMLKRPSTRFNPNGQLAPTHCHNPFPKLSLTQPLRTPSVGFTPPTLFRTPLATVIAADLTRLAPLDQPLSQSNPWPNPHSELALPAPDMERPPRSHGHHVTIVQPRVIDAASSAGHLASHPGT